MGKLLYSSRFQKNSSGFNVEISTQNEDLCRAFVSKKRLLPACLLPRGAEAGTIKAVPRRNRRRDAFDAERTDTLLILNITPPPAIILHNKHSHTGLQSATYYNRGDSDPHLADGTYYGDHGPLFCAAPRNVPLGSVLRIRNPRTGRTIRVVVRDRCRDHIDLSRGAFQRLGGRDGHVPIEAHLEHRGHGRRKAHRR